MIRLLCVSLLFAVAGAASAQQQVIGAPAAPPTELDKQLAAIDDLTELQQLLGRYRAAADVKSEAAVWKRLVALRPHIGQFKYEMAALYGAQDEKTLAYNALLELQAQGYAYDPRSDARFKPIATTEAWDYIAKGFDANRVEFGEGKVVHTLPKDDLLIESIAWDPTRKQLLVGSAREGRVYAVGDDGKLQPLITADAENGLWAVFDLVVDAERGVLWVASTAVPHYKGYKAEKDLGRAGVFKFDLKTGKFLKSFQSPTAIGQAFFMSTLALSSDGSVYAADGVNNAVYQIRDDQLKRLFHNPVLGSIRGLTVSPDGNTLYFADYQRGLFGFDLKTAKPFELLVPRSFAAANIDGVVSYKGNELIVVQGGMNPARIMRLTLAPDGRSVAKVQPLAANQPALQLPTLATRDDRALYVIANSQKGLYDRFGLPRNREQLEGTRIYKVDLESLRQAGAGQ